MPCVDARCGPEACEGQGVASDAFEPAVHDVVAEATFDGVVLVTAEELVIAGTACQIVVASQAIENVIAVHAPHQIEVPRRSLEDCQRPWWSKTLSVHNDHPHPLMCRRRCCECQTKLSQGCRDYHWGCR